MPKPAPDKTFYRPRATVTPPCDGGLDATNAERALLGCLLEAPQLLDNAEVATDDFWMADHQKIWQEICRRHSDGEAVDPVTIATALDGRVDFSCVSGLIDYALPANFSSYVRQVRHASQERKFQRLTDRLTTADPGERLSIVSEMHQALQSKHEDRNWRSIFHSVAEFENVAPLRFAIDGFLQESGITLIGGLSGHGKTLAMLAMAKALLEGSPLFGHNTFSVPVPTRRVLYLIPESSLGPFWSRIQLFRLEEFVRTDRLLVRTLSAREELALDDARLLKAAEGSDIFLDTVTRFLEGAENDVESARTFADLLFRLLASGARTITGAHHSPKGFEGQDFMTLQNVLRGSGDLGAMVSSAWGIRQVDATANRLYVANIKPRDFQPCEPFVLEGRPHLDATGSFKMLHAPGEAEELAAYLRIKGGRPVTDDKGAKLKQAIELRSAGLGIREIAKQVGVGKSTVDRWLFDHDLSHNPVPHGTGFGTTQNPDTEVRQ